MDKLKETTLKIVDNTFNKKDTNSEFEKAFIKDDFAKRNIHRTLEKLHRQ